LIFVIKQFSLNEIGLEYVVVLQLWCVFGQELSSEYYTGSYNPVLYCKSCK